MIRNQEKIFYPANWGVFITYGTIIAMMVLFTYFQQQSNEALDKLNREVTGFVLNHMISHNSQSNQIDHDYQEIALELEELLDKGPFYQVVSTVSEYNKNQLIAVLINVKSQSDLIEAFILLKGIMEKLNENLNHSLKTLNFIFIGLSLLMIIIFLMVEREHSRRYVKDAQKKELDHKLIQLLDQEKHRIALELHDDVAQRLGLVRQYLIQDLSDEHENQEALISLRNLTEAINHIRSLSGELRIPKKELLSFKEQLQLLFSDFTSLSSIRLTYAFNGMDNLNIREEKQLYIYRIIQELLSNGLRHSGAEQIEIRLTCIKSIISIYYSDNGVGTDNGLQSILYRTTILNGKMRQDQGENAGLKIIISIPAQ